MPNDEIEVIASFSDTEEALKVRDYRALARSRVKRSYEDFYQNHRFSRRDPGPGWREK